MRACTIGFLLLLFGVQVSAQHTHDLCGSWRWNVKTLTDGSAATLLKVPLGGGEPETIPDILKDNHGLPKLAGGSTTGAMDRFPDEIPVTIRAYLVAIKREGKDHDLHVVLSPTPKPIKGKTMVMEIPDTHCPVLAGSSNKPARDRYTLLRQWVATNVLPRISMQNVTTELKSITPPVYATITGVKFWDYSHGSNGCAKNGREIHPLLAIH